MENIWLDYVREHEATKEQCMNQLKSLLTTIHGIINSPQYTFQQFITASELSADHHFNAQTAPMLEICLKQLIRQSPIPLVQLVLDYSIHLSSISIIDESTPLLLLEDIMDCTPFEQCKSVLFNILEDRREILTKDMVPNKGKALIILRICNGLLKRAKSIDGSFCGRIIFFLSKIFSLTERSAVNLKGHFNIDDITHIDPPYPGEQESLDFDKLLQTSGPSIQLCYDLKSIIRDLDDVKSPISYPFYQSFWYFQSFCINPPSILSSNPHWILFSTIIVDIVFLIEHCISQRLERQLMDHDLVVKLLSSRQLLKYQLKDPTFLLQLLVQILIVLGYLEQQLNIVEHDKQKIKIDFINHGKGKCLSLLNFFSASCSKTIQMLLKEEEEWVHWKKEGCAPFEQSPIDITFKYVPKPILSDYEYPSGIQDDKDTTELLVGRSSEPRLSDYLSPFIEQLDPREQIEEEYRLDRDPVYVWRVLRLASRQDLHVIIEACKKSTDEDELVQLVGLLSSDTLATGNHQSSSLVSLKE